MLIENTSVKIGDIATIKLINSDEIIARIANIDADKIVVDRPLLLAISLDPGTNRPAINILPFWIMSGEVNSKLEIFRNNILTMTKSNSEASKSWNSMNSSLLIPETTNTSFKLI
jgi:hypothetical protein